MGEYSLAADSVAGLFEPDVVLPMQFFDRGEDADGGIRKLMAALLSDGIEAYINSRSSGPEGDEAREWVETCDESYVFSFDVVCSSLGINADYLRSGLRRYVEAAKQSPGGAAAWKKIRRPRKY